MKIGIPHSALLISNDRFRAWVAYSPIRAKDVLFPGALLLAIAKRIISKMVYLLKMEPLGAYFLIYFQCAVSKCVLKAEGIIQLKKNSDDEYSSLFEYIWF